MTGRCGDRKHNRIGPRQRDVLDTLEKSQGHLWSIYDLIEEIGAKGSHAPATVNRLMRGLRKHGLVSLTLGPAPIPRGRRPFLYSITQAGVVLLAMSVEGKEVRF